MDSTPHDKENGRAPPMPMPSLADNAAIMATAAKATQDTAAYFGVDLTTAQSAETAAHAQQMGLHVMWATTAVAEMKVWVGKNAAPLFGEKFAVLQQSLKQTCDYIETWNKTPARNRLCRQAFVYFANHVTAQWMEGDARSVHDCVRDKSPEVWGRAVCRAFTALARGQDKEQFAAWYATLNDANKSSLRQTYLKVANGIYQLEPADNGQFSGITDQLAQLAVAMRQMGQQFDVNDVLPFMEQMFDGMLGTIAGNATTAAAPQEQLD